MQDLHLICVFNVLMFAIPNISAEKHAYQGSSHVDRLLESLKHEKWRDDEELCKEATLEWLHGVRNQKTWATWIWDSMQQPVAVLYGSRYHLGSYEQCLADPWSVQPSQYCLVDVQLADDTRDYEEVDPRSTLEEFVQIRIQHGKRSINFYSQGVCLPAVCSSSSVAKISQHIHQLSHLPFGNVTVEPRNCQVKKNKTDFSTGFYIFWLIIMITTGLTTTAYYKEDSINNPKLKKLVNWFSPMKNFEALVKTSQDEVKSLHGMRTLCAGTTVVMHYYYVFVPLMVNHVDIAKQAVSTPGTYVIQFALLTEAFFLLSGILHMKGLLTTRSGLMKMIWKRYIRFMIPMVLVFLYISLVLPHTISGPLWPKYMMEQVDVCVRNKWNTLLMINNFVGTDELCPYFSWYLSCDLQLTIIGTVLFWLCQRCQRRQAVLLCIMVYLMSIAVPGVWTYWRKLPPILAYDLDTAIFHTKNLVYQTTYIKPYSRASSYLIGLALGYIMHLRKPKDYKNSISQTWSIIGGFLGFFLMASVMKAGGELITKEYNVFNIVVFTMLEKSWMALGLCLLIVVIEYGNFPLVGGFFRLPISIPLSRLSFGLCLYHPLLIWQNLYSLKSSLAFDFCHLFVNGFGYIFLGLVMSYLFWFIIEAPVVNITNSLFSRVAENKRTAESKENGVVVREANAKSHKQI